MRKIIVLAALIVAFSSIPLFVGYKIQNGFEQQIASLNRLPGYSAEILEYNRGLFSATGKINISFAMAPDSQSNAAHKAIATTLNDGIKMDFNAQHGPLLFEPNLSVGLAHFTLTFSEDQVFTQQIKHELDIEQVFVAHLNMKLGGNGHASVNVAPIEANEDNQSLSFGGLNIEYALGNYGERYTLEGRIQPLKILGEGFEVNSSPILLSGNGEGGDFFWGTGKASVTMDSFSIEGPSSLKATGLALKLGVSRSGDDLMDINYTFSLDTLSSSAISGKVNDSVLNITLANIKQSTLKALSEATNGFSPDTAPFLAEKQAELQSLTGEILAESPKMIIEHLAFNLDEDTFLDLKGELGINADLISDPSAVMGNPYMLIPTIDSHMNARFSKSFVTIMLSQYMGSQMEAGADQAQKTNDMIEQFVQSGFLIKYSGGYKMEASFRAAQFMINGKAMPLPL